MESGSYVLFLKRRIQSLRRVPMKDGHCDAVLGVSVEALVTQNCFCKSCNHTRISSPSSRVSACRV